MSLFSISKGYTNTLQILLVIAWIQMSDKYLHISSDKPLANDLPYGNLLFIELLTQMIWTIIMNVKSCLVKMSVTCLSKKKFYKNAAYQQIFSCLQINLKIEQRSVTVYYWWVLGYPLINNMNGFATWRFKLFEV